MEITCGCKSALVKNTDQDFLVFFGTADRTQGLVHPRHTDLDYTRSAKVLLPITEVTTGDSFPAGMVWSVSGDKSRSGVLLKILTRTRQAPQGKWKKCRIKETVAIVLTSEHNWYSVVVVPFFFSVLL